MREVDVVNVITMILQYLKYIVTYIKPGYPSAINESVSVLVLKKCHIEQDWEVFAYYNGVIITIMRKLNVVCVINAISQ